MAAHDQIQIEHEQETPAGWEHRVRVQHPDRSERWHILRLSFQDYDHWCRGARAPEAVAAAVMRVLVGLTDSSQAPTPLPERIDAGLIRRWVQDADRLVRETLAS